MPKIYEGKNAIKSEMANHIFNRLSQWFFGREMNCLKRSSIQYNARTNGNSIIHLIFTENDKSNCEYYGPGSDCVDRWANNICIYICGRNIEIRIYENGSEQLTYSEPFVDLTFDYLQGFTDLDLFTGTKARPIIENKQAINKWLDDTMITPLLYMLDYLAVYKKVPDSFPKDEKISVLKWFDYAIKNKIATNQYVKIESSYF